MKNATTQFDPRLDAGFLQSIYDDDFEHAVIVFTEFINNTPKMMADIEASFVDGEVEIFRQKVHKLKPVFSFVGLTQITQQAEVLEKKCKEILTVEQIKELYDELKAQYAKGYPVVAAEIERLEKELN